MKFKKYNESYIKERTHGKGEREIIIFKDTKCYGYQIKKDGDEQRGDKVTQNSLPLTKLDLLHLDFSQERDGKFNHPMDS